MINDKFNPINSLKLVGLSKHFLNISRFYKSEKKPSVLLLSGEKGIGKSTLVHHLMFYLFDEKLNQLEGFPKKIKSVSEITFDRGFVKYAALVSDKTVRIYKDSI